VIEQGLKLKFSKLALEAPGYTRRVVAWRNGRQNNGGSANPTATGSASDASAMGLGASMEQRDRRKADPHAIMYAALIRSMPS